MGITDIVRDQIHLKINTSFTYLSKECVSEVYQTSLEIISNHEDACRHIDFMVFQIFIQTKLPVYHYSPCNKEFIAMRAVESASNGLVFDYVISTLTYPKK